MFLSVILIIICGIVYLWQKWHYSFWQRNGVPGPNPSFFVGNIGSVVAQREQIGVVADEWYRKYKNLPYVGYYKLFTPAILVRDMELLRNVLIRDFTSCLSNDFAGNNAPDDLFSGNPFIQTDEEKWKLSRAVMSPMFTTAKLKSIFPLMLTACDKMNKYLEQQGSNTDIEAKSLSVKFTTENVASCVFSVEGNCFEDSHCEFRTMGKKIFQPNFWLGIKFMAFLFLPYIVRLFSFSLITKDVDQWIRRLIRENVRSREIRKPGKHQQDDMLQIMLSLQAKHNLTLDQIAGHSVSFFAGGSEASSTVLSFTLWQVARHRDVQEKLHNEIVTILDKYDNILSFEALNEMEYMNLVIRETMRINNPAMTLHRLCTKPYELPKLPGQKEPVVLQPGTPILIPIYSIHHDPEMYADPQVFNPLRFTDEERQKRPKCSFMPFGEGPRICIGMKFGILQTKLALASVVKNFTLTKSPNCKSFVMDHRSMLMQSRDGLLLRFEKRK